MTEICGCSRRNLGVCVTQNIPFVLVGAIRDGGPLPESIGDGHEAAKEMQKLAKKATTVNCMATMLHTIDTNVQDFITLLAKGLKVM